MIKYDNCPNCSIGLNSNEIEIGFCQNCKHYWAEDDHDHEDEFECCDECDLPDACSDFGCAIRAGLKKRGLTLL